MPVPASAGQEWMASSMSALLAGSSANFWFTRANSALSRHWSTLYLSRIGWPRVLSVIQYVVQPMREPSVSAREDWSPSTLMRSNEPGW